LTLDPACMPDTLLQASCLCSACLPPLPPPGHSLTTTPHSAGVCMTLLPPRTSAPSASSLTAPGAHAASSQAACAHSAQLSQVAHLGPLHTVAQAGMCAGASPCPALYPGRHACACTATGSAISEMLPHTVSVEGMVHGL